MNNLFKSQKVSLLTCYSIECVGRCCRHDESPFADRSEHAQTAKALLTEPERLQRKTGIHRNLIET